MAVPLRAALLGLLLAVVAGGAASAQEGRTTLEITVAPGAGDAFKPLVAGPGEPYVVREEKIGTASPGRERRRTSLLYFGQMSDFQLADEESPLRVEFLDRASGPLTSAWRPQEALGPQTAHEMIRQIELLSAASPTRDKDGRRARMALTIVTGDNADNQQHNEVQQVVSLLDGGTVRPNSGRDPSPVYTGVQDTEDALVGDTSYYDPDRPAGSWSGWPAFPGLLDRAQQPFDTPGLSVPSYVSFGNHDALVQGNQAANSTFDAFATGAIKPFGTSVSGPVPADPDRRLVSKREFKDLHRTDRAGASAHGFGLVDPVEEQASAGAAGYYTWSPRPGLRFVSVDTVCEGGVVGPSAEGNVDDPQFQWLTRTLDAAEKADELVILFSHHAIASLSCGVTDEAAPPCSARPGMRDVNPGCDLDPRSSGPIHLGDDLTALVHAHPHVVAWVAGHTHANRVEPFVRPDGSGGFWSVRVASEIDWPQQSRLLELMDNHDGTLSLFGTIVDHAAPVETIPFGSSAGGATPGQLAAISRLLAANDPQGGFGTGAGEAKDRNVELLIRDPRRAGTPGCPAAGRANTRRGTLGGVRLGSRRPSAVPAGTTRKGAVDTRCVDGGVVSTRYVAGRARVVVSTSAAVRVLVVRPGSRVTALRGRRRVSARWYVRRRAGRATVVAKTGRGGRLVAVGLADPARTRTNSLARKLLAGL